MEVDIKNYSDEVESVDGGMVIACCNCNCNCTSA